MPTFKISKGSWSCNINFPSITEAQEWADNRSAGYVIVLAPSNEQTTEEGSATLVDDKTEKDFQFGNYLLRLFVADNRRFETANNTSITKEDTDNLILAHAKLINYCSIGAINELATELAGVIPNSVFTQERKDKYQGLVTNYLQNI